MNDTIQQDQAPRPLRVLLADAGQQVRERLGEMLMQHDFEVISSDDGFDVLCRLPEWRPDLLLIATDLPRLSGTQVCSLIRQCPDFSSLAVILMGEEHSLLDQARAEIAGANGCLPLPFRMEELRDILSLISGASPHPQESIA